MQLRMQELQQASYSRITNFSRLELRFPRPPKRVQALNGILH